MVFRRSDLPPFHPLGRAVLLIISVGGKNLHQSCAVSSIPGVIIPLDNTLVGSYRGIGINCDQFAKT